MKPGLFTGQKQLNQLTKEDHKSGIQAWVRKVHVAVGYSVSVLSAVVLT